MESLKSCSDVIAVSHQFLLSADKGSFKSELPEVPFAAEESCFLLENTPLHARVPHSTHPRKLMLYNSLPHERVEVVCITTQSGSVLVQTAEQAPVPMQVRVVSPKARTPGR